MRSKSKLALLVGVGAPLMFLSASALADGQTPAPAPAPAPAALPAPAAPTAPASVVAPPPASPPMTVTPVAPPPGTAVVVPAGGAVVVPPGHQDVVVVEHGPGEAIVEVPAVVNGQVKVHIATKELVTLEHRSGPDAPWQRGCETPCDVRLPAADEYRVVGIGVVDSPTFSLTAPKGDHVRVYVAPGIKSKAKVGEALTFTGAVLVVGALVVGIGAADPGSVFQANGTTDNYNWNVIAIGTTVAVAGVITGILGGAWWYDNSHTRVAGDVQEGSEQPVRGGLEPRYQTGMRIVTPSAPAYTVPLFSTTF